MKKNKEGYGYKYTDLAEIHNYLEENTFTYYQFIKRIEGEDYIFTQKRIKDDKGNWINDGEPLQGCRVVQATLSGKSNPAQEQGSALTYARRYSLNMAYGLATEDDDAASLDQPKQNKPSSKVTELEAKTAYALMAKKGLDVVKELQKNFNISNTKYLTKQQYASILKTIKGMPDKEGKTE